MIFKKKDKIKLNWIIKKDWMIRKDEWIIKKRLDDKGRWMDNKKRFNLTENTIHFLKRSVNYITII